MEIIMIIIIVAAFVILFAKPKPMPRTYIYTSRDTPPTDTPPSSPMTAQLELPLEEAA